MISALTLVITFTQDNNGIAKIKLVFIIFSDLLFAQIYDKSINMILWLDRWVL